MSSDNQSDSQETASTSVIEDSLNISFENVCYSVRSCLLSGKRKTLLQDVNGSFNAGELSVIMGQSGAGKSTLMDILAGYTKPESGSIYVNGRLRKEKTFRRRSCYIMQDDKVQDQLTVEESLEIAAELKLGDHISREQKHRRVQEIISSLGLNRARKTKAGALSGGQKKRLAIGLELVSDPPIMFLDEPTSGLDSSISKQLIYLLYLLARQGRTVVITMHQPSAALLSMIDRLYAVVDGRCSYIGSVNQLVPCLERINLFCPPYHNPVDFLIEICIENADKLVESSDNGRNKEWIRPINHETDINLRALYRLESCPTDDVYLTMLPSPKEDPTNKILSAVKSTYSTSYWKQFTVLTRRALLGAWRDSFSTYTMPSIHGCVALCLGLLFYNIGEDAAHVRDNYNFLYFSLMFLMYTAFSVVCIKFPEQLPVVRREHFNRWYSTGAYFSSTLVATLPIQTFCTLLYAFISFYMTGQPVEALRFLQYTSTLLLVCYTALCMGLLNGSLFDVKSAAIFGPLFVMPFTVFSGFFLHYSDAPFHFRWLYHTSFLKHGLIGLLIAIYQNRPKLPCSAIYCHYLHPRQFLRDNDAEGAMYEFVVLALLMILFVVNLLTYISLKIRLKFKI